MNSQVITTEYAEQWPMRAWASVVQTAAAGEGAAALAAGADVGAEAATGFVAAGRFTPARAVGPRRNGDRGASAVEWVIITGIVVAIVVGVGVIISKAITTKATDTGNAITSSTGG